MFIYVFYNGLVIINYIPIFNKTINLEQNMIIKIHLIYIIFLSQLFEKKISTTGIIIGRT